MQSHTNLSRLCFGSFLAAVFVWNATSAQALVINEIRTGQPGTDNQEYFELAGSPGESLAGLNYLVIGDRDSGGGSGVLEKSFLLDGILDYAGYFLAANDWTFHFNYPFKHGGYVHGNYAYGMELEDADNVTHLLVRGFSCNSENCAGGDLDTDDDGVLDLTPWESIIDSVSIVLDRSATTSERYYSSDIVGPDGVSAPGHIYRYPSRTGNWIIGDFDGMPFGYADTPGITNQEVPEPLALVNFILGLLEIHVLCGRRGWRA